MRSAREVLALAVLLSICVTVSFTYTLRDREPWSDTQQLEEALKVIQERRRMIDDEPIGYGDLDFEEEDEDDPLSWDREDQPRRRYMDPETMEYIRDMIYGTENTVADDRWMDEVAPLVDRSSSSNVDMNELSDIMSDEGDEDEEEEKEEDKRVPPDMHKKEYDPSSIPAKKEISAGEIAPDQLTQDEIQEIMEDEAEDALKESLDKQQEEEEEQEEGQETVTDEELKDVLGGDDDEDDETDTDENELFPNMIAKEVDINKESYDDSLPGYRISVKRKRSDYIPSIGDEEVEEAEEQLQGQAEEAEEDDSGSAREYIKQFLALEDDENTNLANALNLATLAQVKKSDRYILEEADYIKRAIEDEQAIQLLKDELSENDARGEDRKRSDPVTVQRVYEREREEVDPELQEAIDEQEKEALHDYMTAKLRQYLLRTGGSLPLVNPQNDIPEYEDSLGKWFNGPVSSEEEGITEEDIALNPFLRELMERYYSGSLSKRAQPILEEEYEPEFEDDDEEDDIDDATKAEIATVLRAYVEDMSPQQRILLKEAVREKLQELEEEEEIQNEIEEEEGYCPALDVLDDCAAARDAGLHLDMEALYMCNRHQMCYTCGSSHGFSATQCDKGYRGEAKRLCDKERYPDKCREDSDILLLDMIEEHIWVPFSEAPPVCSETCAAEYILGIEDKKK